MKSDFLELCDVKEPNLEGILPFEQTKQIHYLAGLPVMKEEWYPHVMEGIYRKLFDEQLYYVKIKARRSRNIRRTIHRLMFANDVERAKALFLESFVFADQMKRAITRCGLLRATVEQKYEAKLDSKGGINKEGVELLRRNVWRYMRDDRFLKKHLMKAVTIDELESAN
jgi:hypothetical protein